MLLKWMAFYMAFCTCNNISRGQIHLNGIAGSKGVCISLKDIANLSFIICTNLHQINAKFPLFDYCQSDRQKVLILCLEFVLLLCIRMNIFYKLKIHLHFFFLIFAFLLIWFYVKGLLSLSVIPFENISLNFSFIFDFPLLYAEI